MTKKNNNLCNITQTNRYKGNKASFLNDMPKIRKIAKCSSSVGFTPLTLRKDGQFINETRNHKNYQTEQTVSGVKPNCLKKAAKHNSSSKVTPLILQKFEKLIEKSRENDMIPMEERLKKKFRSNEQSYERVASQNDLECKIVKCQISPEASGYNIFKNNSDQNIAEKYDPYLDYETNKAEREQQDVKLTIIEMNYENQQNVCLGNCNEILCSISQDEFESNTKENQGQNSKTAHNMKHINKRENFISKQTQPAEKSAKKSILKNSLREKPKCNTEVKKVRFNLKRSPRSATSTISNETNCQKNECLDNLRKIIQEKDESKSLILNQYEAYNTRDRIKLLLAGQTIKKKEGKKTSSFKMKANMNSPEHRTEMCNNDAFSYSKNIEAEKEIKKESTQYLKSNLFQRDSIMEPIEDNCSRSFGANNSFGISDKNYEIKQTDNDKTIDFNKDYGNELVKFLQTISSVLPSHENTDDDPIEMEDILKEALDELPQRLLNCNSIEKDQNLISTQEERQIENNNLNEVNRKCPVEMLSISGTSVTSVSSMSSQSSIQVGNDITQPLHLIRYEAVSKEESECKNLAPSNIKPFKNSMSQLKVNIDRLTELVEQLVEKVDKMGNPKEIKKIKKLGNEAEKELNEQDKCIKIIKSSLKQGKKVKNDFTRNDHCIKSEIEEINKEMYSNLMNNDMNKKNICEIKLNMNKNMVEAGVQTEPCTDLVLQATSMNSTVENAGYAQYCKQGDKMIIKLIKQNTESREICVSKSASALINRLPLEDTSIVTNRSASQMLNEISGINVELILNNIKKQLTTIKLTSPSMYESARSRSVKKQTYGPFKGATQMVQKVLQKLCRCMNKFLHPKQQQNSMKIRQMNEQYSGRRRRPCETRFSLNVLNNFVPFLKGQEDYNGSSNRRETLIGLDTKCSNGCIRTKFKNIKKDQNSDNSLGETFHYDTWPYIKRTKYANGQIYFGPLKQMPEPKPKFKRRKTELHETTSDILHQFKGIQCKCCNRNSIWNVSGDETQFKT